MSFILALFQIITIAICMLMFVTDRPKKIAMLIFAIVCLSEINVPTPLISKGCWLITFCMILSDIFHWKSDIKKIMKTIIAPIVIISLIAFIIHYATSPHYLGDLRKTFTFFFSTEIYGYFGLIYSFASITDEDDLEATLLYSRIALYILTFFAIINFITKDSEIISTIFKNNKILEETTNEGGELYTASERFRVQSLFFNPFNYGYICSILLLLNVYAFIKKLIGKIPVSIVAVCCIFGIVVCGSRTVLICTAVAVMLFIAVAFNFGKALKIVGLLTVLLLTSYFAIPAVQEKIDGTMSAFTATETTATVEGSSLTMRGIQYAAVLYHIDGHEWFGRGKDFFNIDLGWGEGGLNTVLDERLYGLEGVHLSKLLEAGIIGYSLYLIGIFLLLFFLIRAAKFDRIDSGIAIAILANYFLFAHLTGELGSLFPTTLMLGFFIRFIYIAKDKATYQEAEATSGDIEQHDEEQQQQLSFQHRS